MTTGSETEAIESDLEATRGRIDSTIDALQERFSPNRMVDDVMSWVQQGGGSDVMRTVGNTVSSNPIPAAMIGIGVTWLLVNQARGGSSSQGYAGNGGSYGSDNRYRPYRYGDQGRDFGYDRDYAGNRYGSESYGDRYYGEGRSSRSYGQNRNEGPSLLERAKAAFDSVVRQGSETAEDFERRRYEAQGKILGLTQDAGESASAFADRIKRMTSDMTERAGSWASAAAEEGGQMVDDLKQRASSGVRAARDTGRQTVNYLQEQPVLMALTGLAVGAVMGMLLPASRREQELLGDAGRSVREQARSMYDDVAERAQGAAGEAMGKVREAAAQTLGEVRSTIEQTGEQAREAAKGQTGGSGTGGGQHQHGSGSQQGTTGDRPKATSTPGSFGTAAGVSATPSPTLPSSTDIGGGPGANMGTGAPGNGSEIGANKTGGKQGGAGRTDQRPS